MEAKSSDYLKYVNHVAREAGKIILEYYKAATTGVRLKSDRTPVTDADVAASLYICQSLKDKTPWPVVSEEAVGNQAVISQDYYWLVDPLDGTKEFIAQTDEFTVNIALIHQGQAILGVIYAPVFDTLYYAVQKEGAYKQSNGQPPVALATRSFDQSRFLYVVSRRHASQDLESFQSQWPGCRIERVGSSLKFCWIAEGRADLYIRRGPTSEWDTAAAQCILEEAGGKVVTLAGRPLVYNKGQLTNPEFVACGDRNCDIAHF